MSNKPAPIVELKKLLHNAFGHVDEMILSIVKNAKIDLIEMVTNQLLLAGGKRLRPLLTLASTALLCHQEGLTPDGQININAEMEKSIILAAAVELIHTATLLHDDVVDNSFMRRGVETANKLWGNKSSILVGDYIFSHSFKFMVASGSLEALDVLSSASVDIAEAEVWQLRLMNVANTRQEEYLALINAKTASLFAAACETGALVCCDPSPLQIKMMRKYGQALGMCFQIVDDILDYTSEVDTLGKTAQSDFIDGKVTLPLILALERASAQERQYIQGLLDASQEERIAEYMEVWNMVKKHKGVEQALAVAQSYIEEGLNALNDAPTHRIRDLMQSLLLQLKHRVS
jgi:octaprenyl-diphosphate synthase